MPRAAPGGQGPSNGTTAAPELGAWGTWGAGPSWQLSVNNLPRERCSKGKDVAPSQEPRCRLVEERLQAGKAGACCPQGAAFGGDRHISPHHVPTDTCAPRVWAPACGCLSVHPARSTADVCPASRAPEQGCECSHLSAGRCGLVRKRPVLSVSEKTLGKVSRLILTVLGRGGKKCVNFWGKNVSFFAMGFCSVSVTK